MSGLRFQVHVDAAALLATGSARMRLCSLISVLRATQCQISRLEDTMFAVVEHVILLRLTSPGNGWKQKCLPALRMNGFVRIGNFRKRSETHYTRLNVWSVISKRAAKPTAAAESIRLPAAHFFQILITKICTPSDQGIPRTSQSQKSARRISKLCLSYLRTDTTRRHSVSQMQTGGGESMRVPQGRASSDV